ncbi:MAG: PIG-L family deacetylase [Gemmatimonadaceae bacterium]
MKRLAPALALIFVALAAPRPSHSQERGAAALGDLVAGLGTSARVLIVGAHPDDEDTRLIAWLARGRHVETAYLSLTRGDGGQNIIGNELGEALGVVRTEELLAARRIDGATQYFARAYDFGFSKSADEAFRHWPHDTLLGDVVKVVRAFRPHVVITIFSGTPRDGHGQHQVSGIIGREAYDAAGDTVRFPTRTYGAAWTPLKFYRTRTYWGNQDATYRYNSGEYSPLFGRSYAEIASVSRSQHKSQAQGTVPPKGPMIGSLRREASRVDEGTPADQEKGVFDGIDTTYARLAGAVPAAQLRELTDAIAAARGSTDLVAPEKMVAPLARVVRAVNAARASAGAKSGDAAQSLAALSDRAGRALAMAAGVEVEAIAPREVAAVGDTVSITVRAYDRGRAPVRAALRGAAGASTSVPMNVPDGDPSSRAVEPDSATAWTEVARLERPSSPWWLERGRSGDMFAAPASGRAESRDSTPATVLTSVQVAGAEVRVTTPVVYRYADPVKGEVRRPLAAAPAVSITLDRTAEYAPANAPLDRSIRVSLRSASSQARDVAVKLALPAGLAADASTRTVTLAPFGAAAVSFRVRGRLAAGRHAIRATATSGGETFAAGYVPIVYDHIRPQRMYREATIDVQAVDVAVPRALAVAYLPGASDASAPVLRELGVDVTVLDPAAIATADFSRYTTVVLGPRFFEARPELRPFNARLMDFARDGGTVVVQYGQTEMGEPGLMPLPVTYARPADRVTDESSPVRVLDPASPLLTTPNRITDADFAGWVQDRTLYMPHTFDPRYSAPLATNDPGEPSNAAAILAAPVGKGTYVYTTLAFFRQLPAGVPGAARLFVNLLSARDGAARASGGVRASAGTSRAGDGSRKQERGTKGTRKTEATP